MPGNTRTRLTTAERIPLPIKHILTISRIINKSKYDILEILQTMM